MTDHAQRFDHLVVELDQLVGRYMAECQAADMPPADVLASTVSALSDPMGCLISAALDAGIVEDWQGPVINGLQAIIDRKRAERRAIVGAAGQTAAVH